jgi:Tn3 transposase DDE domain
MRKSEIPTGREGTRQQRFACWTASTQRVRIVFIERESMAGAVSVGNPREFLQAEKQEQEMAEACKRLIKNCIICWNYLYLSQKLAEMDDPERREAILNALTHGSAVSWQHVNLLGE